MTTAEIVNRIVEWFPDAQFGYIGEQSIYVAVRLHYYHIQHRDHDGSAKLKVVEIDFHESALASQSQADWFRDFLQGVKRDDLGHVVEPNEIPW